MADDTPGAKYVEDSRTVREPGISIEISQEPALAVEVHTGYPVAVGTGLAFEVPEGHVLLLFSRSGHALKNNVRLGNCVGVIDSDYRGEVKVILTKDDSAAEPLIIRSGDRIAQGMVVPYPSITFDEVESLSDTARSAGGFGSTGR